MMATNNLPEYGQDRNAHEIAMVADQMNQGQWKPRLAKAQKLVELGHVTQQDVGHWIVLSEDKAREYNVYPNEDGCGCHASAKGGERHCKHFVAVEFQKRLNQRSGKMERSAPRKQAQPTQQDPVKQAEEESARECLEAYESTPQEYHRFITLLNQKKKVGGSKQNPIYAWIKKPYMRVDGRVRMAREEGPLDVHTEPIGIFGKPAIRAIVCTVRGKATGTSEIKFSGLGVDSTNPIENAETSAVGRALGNLDYGTLGGIAPAEEVEQAIEQQEQPMTEREVRRAEVQQDVDNTERESLITEIREHIRPMKPEMRDSFFNQFFGCKPAQISEMDTDVIKENWRKACEALVKG